MHISMGQTKELIKFGDLDIIDEVTGGSHADQIFQTTAEAKSEGLESVKHVQAPPPPP